MEPDSRFVIAIPGGLKFSRNLPIEPREAYLSEALVDPRIYRAQPDLTPDSSTATRAWTIFAG